MYILIIIGKLKIIDWFRRIFKIGKPGFHFKDVRLAKPGYLEGNISIGQGTYINSGYRIVSGVNSHVHIGMHCAIGRNFSAAARTHNLERPTSDEVYDTHLIKEASINIGNYVWIGDNVFVREGITIHDYAVIGANSVVVNDVQKFEIVGGNPAKHIRYNTDHYKFNQC